MVSCSGRCSPHRAPLTPPIPLPHPKPHTKHPLHTSVAFSLEPVAISRYVPPMRQIRGILSIVVGLVMIVGGLSGSLVLKGTHSGTALAAFGLIPLTLGTYRLTRPA